MPCDSEYSSMYCNTLNDDNTLQFRASEPSFRKKPSWLSRNLKIDDPTMCSSYSHDIGMANQQMPYTFSRFASTADLAKGTSKAGTKALPGYMGHVPAAEHTVRATTDFGEPLQLKRRKQKEITLKEERRRLRLPHFGMESTQKSAYRKPEGHIQQFQAEEGRCPKVNAMRKGFFSYGGTSDGIASAEKFYHLMRPAEGRLGVGAPEERQWTRQEQLQRSFIFTSTM